MKQFKQLPTLDVNIPTPKARKSASKFLAKADSIEHRNSMIKWAFLNGHVPTWMKRFTNLNVHFYTKTNRHRVITFRTFTDYLTIGNNSDPLRVPIDAYTAQEIADELDCSIPTHYMTKSVWKHTLQKLDPVIFPRRLSDSWLNDLSTISKLNKRIDDILIDRACVRNRRIVGHMKDIILTNSLLLRPNNVAVCGWINRDGLERVVLDISNRVEHTDCYTSVRLFHNTCYIDCDEQVRLQDLFSDSEFSSLVSDEGTIVVKRYDRNKRKSS